jgi:hypothetical protein
MSRRPSANKQELAQIKVLSDSGITPHAIGKRINRDPKTIRRYLQLDVYLNDPELKEMIGAIKKAELDDLTLLNAKGRAHLHTLIDEGNMKPIETIALIDRTFQQRRLIEGQSTENISVAVVTREIEEIDQRIAELRGKLGN